MSISVRHVSLQQLDIHCVKTSHLSNEVFKHLHAAWLSLPKHWVYEHHLQWFANDDLHDLQPNVRNVHELFWPLWHSEFLGGKYNHWTELGHKITKFFHSFVWSNYVICGWLFVASVKKSRRIKIYQTLRWKLWLAAIGSVLDFTRCSGNGQIWLMNRQQHLSVQNDYKEPCLG